jgi:hypothetical protein
MFENLNMYWAAAKNIYHWIKNLHPDLYEEYQNIFTKTSLYWLQVEQEIHDFCKENNIDGRVFFHHNKIRKNK